MKKLSLLVMPLMLIAVVVLPGCTSTSEHVSSSTGASGQRLWAQNCSRCHNSRSPSDYNNTQWDVAMLHMRIRANLTAEEHVKIQRFLQEGE